MRDDLQDHNSLEEALIRAGAFHPDDLDENYAGYLSPAQKRWLALEAAFWLTLAGLELGLTGMIWIFYFQHHIQTALLLGLTWGFFLVIIASMCIHDARPILEELRDGRVEDIAGMLSKHVSFINNRGGRGAHCSIEIHNHLFGIAPSTYNAIIDHHSYRLFYTPKNRTLVNIEPLPRSDEKKRSALAALQNRVATNPAKSLF
jgi:hypothetical protein